MIVRWGAAFAVAMLLGVPAGCGGSPAPSPSGPPTVTPSSAAVADPDDDTGQDTSTDTVVAAAPHLCTVQDGRADVRCTPGVTNPQVTQATIGQTICVRGWTATIRPPASYTTALKRQQMVQYGESGSLAGYEEDHLIPLEAGGDPRDPRNLWPEPRSGTRSAAVKDRAENAARESVCSGRMSLAAAQAQIQSDWTH